MDRELCWRQQIPGKEFLRFVKLILSQTKICIKIWICLYCILVYQNRNYWALCKNFIYFIAVDIPMWRFRNTIDTNPIHPEGVIRGYQEKLRKYHQTQVKKSHNKTLNPTTWSVRYNLPSIAQSVSWIGKGICPTVVWYWLMRIIYYYIIIIV